MITISDARAAGYCVAGIRRWFDLHDLDFRSFVQEGIEPEKIEALGDGAAAAVIEKYKERIGGR